MIKVECKINNINNINNIDKSKVSRVIHIQALLIRSFFHSFWANVCKTVRPMLSDRCPVCLSVLSCPICEVGVLWPNGCMDQIKMKLSKQVGIGPGDFVLDGNPAPRPPKRGTTSPIFGPCLSWRNGRPSQLLLSSCISSNICP